MASTSSNRRNRVTLWVRTVAALLTLVSAAAPAPAINIVLVFNDDENETPDFDADNSGLQQLFQYAEQFYESVFKDVHTLTINYWYEDLVGSPGTVGRHNRLSQSGGRTASSNIRIDPRIGDGGAYRDWFLDPTPWDDSEFEMDQTFWRDLTGLDRAVYYSNFGTSIPGTFEVGYGGLANLFGPAIGMRDMLSTILHEIGHALGVGGNDLANLDTIDGDYDFDPAWVFNKTLGVDVADDGDDWDTAHLYGEPMLMSSGRDESVRERPSHTDLFAMAAGSNFTLLDVPRRELYGASWEAPTNWSGARLPDGADDVFVRSGGVVGMGTVFTALANNLVVSDGTDLTIAANNLIVANELLVDEDATVTVTGGEVEAGRLVVDNFGILSVSGGSVDVFYAAVIDSTGSININGGTLTVGEFNNAAGGTFNLLSGQLTIRGGRFLPNRENFVLAGAGPGVTARLKFTNGGTWDEPETLTVANGRNGRLEIESGSRVTVGSSLLVGADDLGAVGTIIVTGADSELVVGGRTSIGMREEGSLQITNQATMRVDRLMYIAEFPGSTGTVSVSGAGTLIAENSIIVGAGGTLSVSGSSISAPTINNLAGGVLNFRSGFVHIQGGQFQSGQVDFVLSGTSVFEDPWLTLHDGATWQQAGTLTVGDRRDGTLVVRSGSEVNVGGSLIAGGNTLYGATGTINLEDEGSSLSTGAALRIGYREKGMLNVGAGASVSVVGAFTLAENPGSQGTATIDEGGTVDAMGGVSIGAAGTLNLRGTLRAPSLATAPGGALNFRHGVLEIDAGVFQPGGNYRVQGEDAASHPQLTLRNGATWSEPAELTVGGIGDGTLVVENGAQISVGQNLIIGRDNLGRTGVVHITGEGSRIAVANRVSVGLEEHGQLTVADGGELSVGDSMSISGFDYAEAVLNVESGGAVHATNNLSIGVSGTVIVSGGVLTAGRINQFADFGLAIGGEGEVRINEFNGNLGQYGGLLAPRDIGAGLTINGNATFDIGGLLELGIGGPDAGEFDVLRINGAEFNGTGGGLIVSLQDLSGSYEYYIPELGDRWQIVESPAAPLDSFFGYISLPDLTPGLRWRQHRTDSSFAIEVVQQGDFDNDDDVDADDLARWKPAYGQTVQGDGDGDGDTDGHDFLIWQRHLGRNPTAIAANATVPEPHSLALLATLALALRINRRALTPGPSLRTRSITAARHL
jgi:T5SS/PEP-CTERM-associated repeat protein